MTELNEFDKKLLNLLQHSLPLTERPFCVLGEELGVSEAEVLERTRELKAAGYIRRIGAFFDSGRLGYQGTLIALRVRPTELESVALEVNKLNGVTHNYQREGKYNLWFTLQSPSFEAEERTTAMIERLPGVEEMLNVCVKKKYKINVEFKL